MVRAAATRVTLRHKPKPKTTEAGCARAAPPICRLEPPVLESVVYEERVVCKSQSLLSLVAGLLA